MKGYIITIIGATLMSAATGILAPEKWRGYVKLITGLVIISCIISPVATIFKSDIFEGFDNIETTIQDSTNMQTELVKEELKNRIDEDIGARMKKEFGFNITADCEVRINDEGEIEGVDNVYVYGDKLTERAKNRICEVYGLEYYEVKE